MKYKLSHRIDYCSTIRPQLLPKLMKGIKHKPSKSRVTKTVNVKKRNFDSKSINITKPFILVNKLFDKKPIANDPDFWQNIEVLDTIVSDQKPKPKPKLNITRHMNRSKPARSKIKYLSCLDSLLSYLYRTRSAKSPYLEPTSALTSKSIKIVTKVKTPTPNTMFSNQALKPKLYNLTKNGLFEQHMKQFKMKHFKPLKPSMSG